MIAIEDIYRDDEFDDAYQVVSIDQTSKHPYRCLLIGTDQFVRFSAARLQEMRKA